MWEYLPDGVKEFYDRLKDKSIPDEEIFKSKMNGHIGNCDYTLGFGGIHGDCGNCLLEDKLIINQDVGSYYPHLVTINGYCSRAVANPKDYEIMLDRRMKAKASGDKKTANALKLVCNSTYGAFGDKYNKLYDPKMMRSVCISGQLYLLELSNHLHSIGADIIQINTDGVMFMCSSELKDKCDVICKEWEHRTHFELEADSICKVIQKDVNNYLEIKNDGSFKCKGGYLVRGIAPAGAFNINNNFPIVSQAVIDYFTKGIYPEETITKCNDIFQFQIIAKASGKYSKVVHIVDGDEVQVQKCNRVYATNNLKYGRLYKYHKVKQTPSVIANLPEHCIIDNANQLSINNINKRWYITLAYKYINDFLGDD